VDLEMQMKQVKTSSRKLKHQTKERKLILILYFITVDCSGYLLKSR